jgi:hypothetical protein
MELLLLIGGAMLASFGVACWFTMVVSYVRLYFHLQPGVSSFWVFYGVLFSPQLFTEKGQKARRLFVRSLQGFLGIFLALPAVFIGKAISSPSDVFYVEVAFCLAMAVGLLLILAALESLLRP